MLSMNPFLIGYIWVTSASNIVVIYAARYGFISHGKVYSTKLKNKNNNDWGDLLCEIQLKKWEL